MKSFKIIEHTGDFITEEVEDQKIEKEITKDVKIFEEEDDKYSNLLYRAKLDVELHNRDNADKWSVIES